MIEEAVQEFVDIDKKSESKGTGLAIFKYIAALAMVGLTGYGTYLQNSMSTKFEVLNERLSATNKQLEENRIFVQKLMLDLHAVELTVKELQFNDKIKKGKN